MRVSQEVQDAIDRAAKEGRVTEGGKAVLPGLVPLPFPMDEISEKDFMQAVIDLARKNGWIHYHVHFSQRSKEGFPDLWLAKDRIIHVELKTETGELTADQCRYRDAVLAAKGEWHLWRPSMWQQIVNILEGVS